MAHFDRERIPERVVHAKGAGAFGYFEVTHDITDLCKVGYCFSLFSPNKTMGDFLPGGVAAAGWGQKFERQVHRRLKSVCVCVCVVCVCVVCVWCVCGVCVVCVCVWKCTREEERV